MIKKRFLSMLVLLMVAVTGAVAQAAFVFTGSAGDQWSNVANWTCNGAAATGLPTAADNVTINADCAITDAQTAANVTIKKNTKLTIANGGSLNSNVHITIKDGGQLFAPTGSNYGGTFEKKIRGYGDSRLGNYYLLAMPITNFNLANGFANAGMFPNGDPNSTDYDLYFFSQNHDFAGEMDQNGDGVIDFDDDWDGLWYGEWQNYKWYINDESGMDVTDFTDEVPNNYAYLYANKENTTLSFNGTFYAGNQTRQCYYVGAADWDGLQLVGNPLPCNASLTYGYNIKGFYMINEANHRRDVVAIEGSEAIVAPATAVFVEAFSGNNDEKRVTFVPSTENATVRSAKGFVTIEVLSSDGILEDRAYVRDYESEGLSKFSRSNEGAKIYIPQNGKKYAAVSGTNATTLPLCFTTNEGGIHTLTVKPENMDCDYLHLVDNATGADIDLLRTPKYSFNASDCPYATRFKLVFAEEATNDIADNLLNRGKSKQSSIHRSSPYSDSFYLPVHGGIFNGDADFDPGEDPIDPPALALNETTDNCAALTEWDGYETDVTMTRTLQTGGWNTFSVPFDLDTPNGWTVKELTASEFNNATGLLSLTFGDALSIEAGKPYLVKVGDKDVVNPTFPDVTIVNGTTMTQTTAVDFIPTLGKTTIENVSADDVLFVAAGNLLKHPAEMPANMKGFRAYFQLKGEATQARAFSLDFGDGETTGIKAIDNGKLTIDNVIYDLQGRKVQNAAAKGMYIVNGKKVIIK